MLLVRTMHIDVYYHFIIKVIAYDDIVMSMIFIHDIPIDIMTKELSIVKFELCLGLAIHY